MISLGGFVLLGVILLRGAPVIEEIKVEGGERIGASQVLAASGLQVGQRWTKANRQQALQGLQHLHGVQAVKISIKRRSGGRVEVKILLQEREPYGLISVARRGLFWVDREGYLLGKLQGKPYLPVITGLSISSMPEGERIEGEQALRLVQEFFALEGRWLSRFKELRFRGYDLELLTQDGRHVLLPPSGLLLQLKRLDRLMSALNTNWHTLDLRFEGEVILR